MSNKIAGMDVENVVLLAALAIGGFFIYKAVIKPVSQVTETGAKIATSILQPKNLTPIGWMDAGEQIAQGLWEWLT
jgi:hypothetical protein